MHIVRQPTAFICTIALFLVASPASTGDLQDEQKASQSIPPPPSTCAELSALDDSVNFTSPEIGMLKQHCDLKNIRAEFAKLDRDQDGYIKREELPAGHVLRQDYANVDLNDDDWLSLAEVAEYDAEMAPIE